MAIASRICKKNICLAFVGIANIDEIANATSYLKVDKDIAKQMGANGRKAFEEKFNRQIEEKKLIKLYNYY